MTTTLKPDPRDARIAELQAQLLLYTATCTHHECKQRRLEAERERAAIAWAAIARTDPAAGARALGAIVSDHDMLRAMQEIREQVVEVYKAASVSIRARIDRVHPDKTLAKTLITDHEIPRLVKLERAAIGTRDGKTTYHPVNATGDRLITRAEFDALTDAGLSKHVREEWPGTGQRFRYLGWQLGEFAAFKILPWDDLQALLKVDRELAEWIAARKLLARDLHPDSARQWLAANAA